MKRRAARLISWFFDPVMILPLVMIWIISQTAIPWLLMLTDLVMPGFAFVYFLKEHHFKDLDIHRRRQRFPMLFVMVLCQGAGLTLNRIAGKSMMTAELVSIFLVMLVLMGVSIFWKISLHMAINSLLAMFLTVHFGWWWVWIFLPIIGWARVIDRDHTLSQVVMGSLIPPLVYGISLWYI